MQKESAWGPSHGMGQASVGLAGMEQGQAEGLVGMRIGGSAVSVPVLSPVLTPHSSQAVRKLLVSGGGGCSCTRVWPSLPPPPPVCCGSQREDGKSCWRGLSAPAGRHSLKCSQVHACHTYTYTHTYISHIHVHTCKHPTITHKHLWHTPTYTLLLK